MKKFQTQVLMSALCVFGIPVWAQADPVKFNVQSVQNGRWSDPKTWSPQRLPRAGDYVQIRPGHQVTYDVHSAEAIRLLHVSGTLAFSRDRSTLLVVGLIKVQPGEEATEDGFFCDYCPVDPKMPMPALEIGTPDNPIPAGVTATIRLVHFAGTDKETLPAILVCRGRWDVYGVPLSRTWIQLGATANPGDAKVSLAEPVTGWKAGDRVILTRSKTSRGYKGTLRGSNASGTEERTIVRVEGTLISGAGRRSIDQGKTWQRVKPFPKMDYGSDMIALTNGYLVAVQTFKDMSTQLVASRDDGATWDLKGPVEIYNPGRPHVGRPHLAQIDQDTLGVVFPDNAAAPEGSGASLVAIGVRGVRVYFCASADEVAGPRKMNLVSGGESS